MRNFAEKAKPVAEQVVSRRQVEVITRPMRDLDVRLQLHAMLASTFRNDPSTVIFDELGICQGAIRVDVAAVNCDLYGYEIKAAADTLKRLDNQVTGYGRVLDFAAWVMAPKHLSAAKLRSPGWWGLYVAHEDKGGMVIDQDRAPTRNLDINVRSLAELLWHSETLQLLTERSAARGLASKPRAQAWDRLCDVYTLDEIRNLVRRRLKERLATRSGSL